MDYEILTFISEGVFWIVEIIILIACIILVVKHKNTSFKMMLAGIVLSMLLATIKTIIFALPIFDTDIEQRLFTNGILSILQAIGYSLFGLGLIIYALNYNKKIG
ncbi:hypothetical protein SCB49_01032 [unidentified eubacterium SCB49]|nr:hypothetical protein SCB49_01032 [unidentified eubacterium SCB49]